MAAHQEARRGRRGRLGRRGPPAERQDRPDQRRRQGRPRRPLERPGAGGRGRDRPDRGRRGARCRRYIEPMLATLASKPFSDPDWLYEIKWDGFRVQAVIDGGKVKTWTRNLKDAETYFPRLLSPAALDRCASRRSSMARSSPSTRPGARTSPAPDASSASKGVGGPRLPGRSTCSTSTAGRCSTSRSRIASGCSRACSRPTRASASPPHVVGEGEAFFEAARANRLEGIIAKLRRTRYEPGGASNGLAEAQDPARAGAGRRRLDARRGQRPGSRRAGRRRLRGRQAAVRRQGRVGVHRRDAQGAAREAQAARRSTTRPFDPPPPKDYRGRWGGDLGDGHLGPARARDPRGARRLDARRASSARPRSRASSRAATR